MQEKESPKIAHVKLPSDWVRFKNQFLHTFLSPCFPPCFPRVSPVFPSPCFLSPCFPCFLSQKERQILALYYFEERTMKEIGRALGLHQSRDLLLQARDWAREVIGFRHKN